MNGLNRWCYALPAFFPGSLIEPDECKNVKHGPANMCKVTKLASQCLPKHYCDNGIPQPASAHQSGQAIASPPITCELCGQGLAGFDSLTAHCEAKHGCLAEYRKRVFYKCKELGFDELQAWVKRNISQNYQFWRLHSVPASKNDWTMSATRHAERRREEACAVCAVRDWLENRFQVYPFQQATGTTSMRQHCCGSTSAVNGDSSDDNDEEEQTSGS